MCCSLSFENQIYERFFYEAKFSVVLFKFNSSFMKYFKYAMPFILPVLFFCGLKFGDWVTFAPVLFAFGFIPGLELLIKPNAQNLETAETEMRREDRKYDFLLYLVAPAIYACIVFYLFALQQMPLEFYEKMGLTISLGVILGGLGINVAHELGHRTKTFEQNLAKILLLPSAYMHFFIEHNRGHHKNVSTPHDPATSRRNEMVYQFWIRSLVMGYMSAWKIENQRLIRQNQKVFTLKNEMLRFQLIQIAFWMLIGFTFGLQILIWYTGASIVGFLMLETVNYIEHYGLMRSKITDFRYEKVQPTHSWNSNHVIGRLMLFELSRHSDHHFQPQKKYQLLEHHDHSPQMPTGYPGMMLLSLIPPLWFLVMNPKI